MASLAKYVVALEAQTAQYVAELQKANTQLAKFHKDQTEALDKIYDGFKRLAEAVGAFEFARFVKDQIDATAETARLADRLGITVTALSELQYAAKASDIPVESLTTSMQFLAKNLTMVAEGAGKKGAAQALSDLHLNATELLALPLDKQLETVVDALGKVPNRAQAIGEAMQLLGRGGAVLLQLAGHAKEFREEAERLGIALGQETAARAEEAHHALVQLTAVLQAAGREFAVSFAPAITAAVEQINVSFGGMSEFFDALVSKVVFAVGLMEDAFYGWQKVIIGTNEAILNLQVYWKAFTDFITDKKNWGEALDDARVAAAATAAELERQMSALVAAGPPSEKLQEAYLQMKNHAKEAADAAVKLAGKEGGAGGLVEPQITPKFDKKAWLESFGTPEVTPKMLAAPKQPTFATGFGDQAGIEKAVSDQKLKIWGDETKYYENELLKRQRADMDAWNVQMQHDRKHQFDRINLWASATGAMSDLLTALVARHGNANKTMLRLQRAVALADIGINTARAVMQAFANLPPPASYVAAGVAIAEGAAQAVNVRSASDSFSAGTASTVGVIPLSSSAIGEAAGAAAGAAVTSKGAVQIIFQGDVFGWDESMKKRVVDSLRDLIDNKDVVIIGQNSRQAFLLGGGG